MNKYLVEAQNMFDELLTNRHYLHQHAEIMDELPVTTAYVKEKLTEYGIEWQEISKCGIVALIKGEKPGKVVLLRTDMDALDMTEESDLDFHSVTKYAHCCGHDIHNTMMLGACKILSQHRDEIEGTVKVMFQPGEEYFIGAKAMVAAGVLENPHVDAAFDMHVNVTHKVGQLAVFNGPCFASCDGFKITLTGVGCHGSQPYQGVDPINAAVHVYMAFQELVAREVPGYEMVALTIGQISAGNAANIIPKECVMQGTLRCYNMEVRAFLMQRMQELLEGLSKAYRVEYKYEVLSDVPVVCTSTELQEAAKEYCADMGVEFAPLVPLCGSEDFGEISQLVPSAYFGLGACPEDYPAYSLHNPKIRFDERCMPIGVATHVNCAIGYLKNNK